MDPQKILKIVLTFSVVILVMWLFMVSRMEFTGGSGSGSSGSGTQEGISVERADSLRTILNRERGDSAASDERSSGIFMNAFTTFIILVSILGVVWFWSKTKGSTAPKRRRELKEMGAHSLGNGAQLKIVELNGEIWVMGVTQQSVNLLHRYSKDEWNEEKEPFEVPSEDDNSFSAIFRRNQ